jgi:hypothetical protein
MKKITIFLLSALLPVACNILESEVPEHLLVGEHAIVDEASARNALNGVYAYLQHDANNSSTFTNAFSYEYAVAGALKGGLLEGGQRNTFDRELRTFAVDQSSTVLPDFYKLCYRIVNAANNVIYYTERLQESKIEEGPRKEIIAQARFLRGFAHFWIMKLYCYFWDVSSIYGPILRLEPTSTSTLYLPRATVREGYESIISDYDYCIENGPETHVSVFTICRTAAKAFKSEALMIRGEGSDYADALTLADEVINSGEFNLEPTFADVFKQSNDYKKNGEMIFSRALSPETIEYYITYPTATGPYAVFSKACGSTNAFYLKSTQSGGYYPILIEGDARDSVMWAEVTVTSGNPPVEKTGTTMMKIWRSNANCPSYIMRLAQMYIIKAEALARTGASVDQVLAPLNILRTRSGNTVLVPADYPDTPDGKALLMESILNEYVLELGVENSSEWFAMVRIKDVGGVRLIGKFNSYFSDDAQICLPFPADEIALNKGLVVQNPIYSN